MKVSLTKGSLIQALSIIRRPQVVSGKKLDQAASCVVVAEPTKFSITSLSTDMTTLTYTEWEADNDLEEPVHIPIPDIASVQNILAMHATDLTIEVLSPLKIRFKSGRKQTTLDASLQAKASAYSQTTLIQNHEKGTMLMGRVDWDNLSYTDGTGKVHENIWDETVDATDMYDALRCDNINGQKMNRYVFTVNDSDGFRITTGDTPKGKTESLIRAPQPTMNFDVDATFGNGLDSLFGNFNGDARMAVISLGEHGHRLAIKCGDTCVFQTAVVA